MFRLVIGLASFNIFLSVLLVTNIVQYEKKVVAPLPLIPASPVVSAPPVPIPDDKENAQTPVTDSGKPPVVKEDIKTLSEIELNAIPSGRNPFGAPPSVDENLSKQEASYQEKIESIQQKYEQIAKEKELEELRKENNNLPTAPDNVGVDEPPAIDGSSAGTATKPVATTPTSSRLEKSEAVSIAKEKALKYQVPAEWIVSLIEETSNYQADLIQTKDQSERKGIMQIREDRAKFIMESLGRYYQPSLVLNATMNIEMGAWYLSYLSKLHNDKEYIFTAYYYGESYAKTLKASQGNYRSAFSEDIIRKIATINLN